jgi:hypothetical protein
MYQDLNREGPAYMTIECPKFQTFFTMGIVCKCMLRHIFLLEASSAVQEREQDGVHNKLGEFLYLQISCTLLQIKSIFIYRVYTIVVSLGLESPIFPNLRP